MARYRLSEGDSFEPTPEPADQITRTDARRKVAHESHNAWDALLEPADPVTPATACRNVARELHNTWDVLLGALRQDVGSTLDDRTRALRGEYTSPSSARRQSGSPSSVVSASTGRKEARVARQTPIDLTGESEEQHPVARHVSTSPPQPHEHSAISKTKTKTKASSTTSADSKACTCLPCMRQRNSSSSAAVAHACDAHETKSASSDRLSLATEGQHDGGATDDEDEEWHPELSANGDAEPMTFLTHDDVLDEVSEGAGRHECSDLFSLSNASSEQLCDDASERGSTAESEGDAGASAEDDDDLENATISTDSGSSDSSHDDPPSGCEFSDDHGPVRHSEGSADPDTDRSSDADADEDEEGSIQMEDADANSETASEDESNDSWPTNSDESDDDGSSASEAPPTSPAKKRERDSPSHVLKHNQRGAGRRPSSEFFSQLEREQERMTRKLEQRFRDFEPLVPSSKDVEMMTPIAHGSLSEEAMRPPPLGSSMEDYLASPPKAPLMDECLGPPPVSAPCVSFASAPKRLRPLKTIRVLQKADEAGASLRARLESNSGSDLDDSVGSSTEDEMAKLAAAYDEPSSATVSPLTASSGATTAVEEVDDAAAADDVVRDEDLPKRAPSPSLSQVGEGERADVRLEGTAYDVVVAEETFQRASVMEKDCHEGKRQASEVSLEVSASTPTPKTQAQPTRGPDAFVDLAQQGSSHCSVAHSAVDAHPLASAEASPTAAQADQPIDELGSRMMEDISPSVAVEDIMTDCISGKRKRGDDDAERRRGDETGRQPPAAKRMRPVSLVALGFSAGFVAGSASLFAGLSWLGGE